VQRFFPRSRAEYVLNKIKIVLNQASLLLACRKQATPDRKLCASFPHGFAQSNIPRMPLSVMRIIGVEPAK
jgi:hypothetical protein